ncbi:hypothetical protein QU38_01700, partial [Staphylococcus aureus]
AQGAGSADRLLAGGMAEQGRDPLALSLERLFRRQCLWPAGRGAPLFQHRARRSDPEPGHAAGRAGAGAFAARPHRQSEGRARAAETGDRRDGGCRADHQGAGGDDPPGRAPCQQIPGRPAQRHLFRRLGAAPGARPGGRRRHRADGAD